MKKLGLKKNKKGFTLVEIIVVLVIIGILLALAVPAITKYVGEAGETKLKTQVKAAFTAAQTVTTSEVAKNPAISDTDTTSGLPAKVTKDTVNDELGLATDNSGAVKSITCTFNDQRITSCDISTNESDTIVFTVEPNKEPVKKTN